MGVGVPKEGSGSQCSLFPLAEAKAFIVSATVRCYFRLDGPNFFLFSYVCLGSLGKVLGLQIWASRHGFSWRFQLLDSTV